MSQGIQQNFLGPRSTSDTTRVLIVEDEALIALDLERRLVRLGFEVVGTADNHDDAVALFTELMPDLVMMDISIRGPIDGIEVARSLGKIADKPVIFLTAYADDTTVARAAEVSPYGYIQKPFDDRTLAATVKISLARHASDRVLRVLASVVSSATIGILIVEVAGKERPIVFANDAFTRLSGRPASDFLGKRPCFLAEEAGSEGAVRLADAIDSLTPASATVRGRRSDTEYFWSAVTVSPVVEPGGRVSHIVLLHADVTREREAQDMVAEMQRTETVGQVAASIAHDFNNILTVIQTFATLARDSVADPAVKDDLNEVQVAARSGAMLTRRLLDYTHRGAKKTASDASDMTRVVRETRRMLEATGGQRVNLDLRIHPEPMFVDLDVSSIEQILLNLVANARDAMLPAGGSVAISTHRPVEPSGALKAGTFARIEVRDTGPGIEPAMAARIFEPFFTTKPRGRGTGLGLATCRMLIERAGGSIVVKTAPGEGTTFVIDVPILEARTADDVEELAVTLAQNANGAPCLLVEPDGPLRRAYARVLLKAGFTVTEAATGQAACRALDTLGDSLRLLVCSASLPVTTGADVPGYARTRAPGTPIFLLTSIADASSASVASDVTVLWRPVTASTLARRALDAIEGAEKNESRDAANVASPTRADAAEHATDGADQAVPVKRSGPQGTAATGSALSKAHAAAGNTRPIVLIVEDDEAQRRGLALVLEGRGMEVWQAGSCAQANARLATGAVSGCLVDVDLPDGNGLELLTVIRAGDPHMPVLVMTGDPSVSRALEAMRGRAAAFLAKPFDMEVLVAELERALREGQIARLQHQLLMSKQGSDAMLGDLVATREKFEQSLSKLYTVFQPIVLAQGRHLYAYEALMRSHGPYANPGDLLAAGDVLGRIDELGRTVRRSIAQALEDHPERSETIFVNLHPMEFTAEILTQEDEPLLPFASRVVFEVTERAQLSSTEDLEPTLRAIRAAGYRVALDDLGEGYAGLSWLVKLVPDIAKLDMSLVRDLHHSRMKRELVGSLVSVCRRAQTLVVAEGVEVAEEAAVLKDLGCDLLQGYHFARPGLPFPELPPVST